MEETQLQRLYEQIIENYYGTILVIDSSGKVVYINEHVVSNTKGITRDEIIGSQMADLVRQGCWQHSPSMAALQSGRAVTEYLEGNVRYPLMTTSIPVFDDSGALQYVMAYSQGINYVDDMLRKLNEERSKIANIISFTNALHGKARVVAESKAMKEIYGFLETVSHTDSTILICGESGTGKEVVAKHIHQHSLRRNELFLPVNCAALPPDLIEAELFGYEKGAFTGASKEGKTGLFELAHNGTLFLDEVGELPLALQSKLLRVLENGEVKKIGSNQIKLVNIRIIAATNRNLLDMIHEKTFREDLYYRLNVIPVTLPPIRERTDDIYPLCCSFLRELNEKYGKRKQFDDGVRPVLEQYSWPGNVREIRNVVERLFVTTPFEIISANDVPLTLVSSAQRTQYELSEPVGQRRADGRVEDLLRRPYRDAQAQFESLYLKAALKQFGGNVAKTAKAIGISRSDLYYKLQSANLDAGASPTAVSKRRAQREKADSPSWDILTKLEEP